MTVLIHCNGHSSLASLVPCCTLPFLVQNNVTQPGPEPTAYVHLHTNTKAQFNALELPSTQDNHSAHQIIYKGGVMFRRTVMKPVFLPHDALQCKAWSCYRTSSVRLSVCDAGGSWPHRL